MNHKTFPLRLLFVVASLVFAVQQIGAFTLTIQRDAMASPSLEEGQEWVAPSSADSLCVVSGVVTNDHHDPMPHVNVTVPNEHVAVVTNEDGLFTLKCQRRPAFIILSHVGYHQRRVNLSHQLTGLHIQLMPASVVLQDVIVVSQNAREILEAAMAKIPYNYNDHDELYTCFYRETVQKRQRYINVAEAVAQLYKTPVYRNPSSDRVAIEKGRRLLSPKTNDTLGVKIMGGPNTPIWIDIVKNKDFILNDEDLQYYDFQMEVPTILDERPQYVIRVKPVRSAPYALFSGLFYIDRETLAFTRAELSLDMSDRLKATRYMLVRKPAGVRFKPREMTVLVNYHYDGTQTRISYVRALFRFNCDWKRRLLATSFTAKSELVVTDRAMGEIKAPRGRDTFFQRDAFFDKVAYFEDPDFWHDYNIIEPSESLEQAIDKLRKKIAER